MSDGTSRRASGLGARLGAEQTTSELLTELDLDAKTATLEEVEDAIRGLSPADVARLEGFAAAKARALGVAGMDLDAAGLLNNALEKTLRGDRRWRPEKVGFVGHLLGVIRSDVSHHGEQVTRGRPVVSAAADSRRVDDDGRVSDPVEDHAGDDPTPEREVAARERLAALAKLFAGDDDVTLVLEALAQEMKGPEIQDDLGISKTEYETIMKRMRRKARAHDQQEGSHV